jgi:hypothetical protein
VRPVGLERGLFELNFRLKFQLISLSFDQVMACESRPKISDSFLFTFKVVFFNDGDFKVLFFFALMNIGSVCVLFKP